jgi:hypothetical protein
LLTTLGEGASLKSSRWGVAWKRGTIGADDDIVEVAGMGGGLQAETGDCGRPGVGGASKHTLGGLWGGTLGWADCGEHMGRKARCWWCSQAP